LRFRFTVVVIKSRRLPGDLCSLWGAQLRRTSRAFAQWNLILAHLQHLLSYMYLIPCRNVSLVVCLHQGLKHKFLRGPN